MTILGSVVITTYNDHRRLSITLSGFLSQTFPPMFEIIVVSDGESKDSYAETLRIVNRYHSTTLPFRAERLEPESSDFRLAASRNLGISLSEGSRIIICDCDTFPSEKFVGCHLELPDDCVGIGLRKRISIENSERVLCSGQSINENMLRGLVYANDDRVTGNRRDEFHALQAGRNNVPWKICWGCNFSAPAKLIKKLGGFDTEFVGWGGEDEDLAERLHRSGAPFVALTDCFVYHFDHPARTTQTAIPTYLRKLGGPLVRNGGPLGG